MQSINLSECEQIGFEETGRKAWWISKMINLKRKVPQGIVIPVEVFNRHMQQISGDFSIGKLLDEVKNNPIYARKNLSFIREKIRTFELDSAFMQEILNALEEAGVSLAEGVAVRSSSVNEDSGKRAFAGIYSSYIDVHDADELEEAVLGVWASNYTEAAFLYGSQNYSGMAVIIQQMAKGDYHGVVFTKAPNRPSHMMIEVSETVTGIVDGAAPDMTVYVDKSDLSIETEGKLLTDEQINELVKESLYLEEKLRMFCDIEWSIKGNEINILQCRPISGTCEEPVCALVISQDDDDCRKYYFGNCQKYYTRYLGKQRIFREAVLKAGFKVYKQYYVVAGKDNMSEVKSRLEKLFSPDEFVILEFGESKKYINCRFENACEEIEKQFAIRKTDYIYARIGEVIMADKSGYSSLNEDGGVLAEYIMARMSGLKNGKITPCQAIIQESGTEYLYRPGQKVIEVLNEKTGKREKRDYGKVIDELKEYEAEEIYRFTKVMSGQFPNCRLEWYFYNNALYGKDISMETNELRITAETKGILSPGEIEGEAVYLFNLEELDALAGKYNISLYVHSEEEMRIYEDSELKKIRDDIERMNNAIVFAKRPSIGIMAIADVAKGFVFRQGAFLSHVGICLREKGIAAVVDREAYDSNLPLGTAIRFEKGHVVLKNEADKNGYS